MINFRDFPIQNSSRLTFFLSYLLLFPASYHKIAVSLASFKEISYFFPHMQEKNKQFLLGLVTMKWCGQLYSGMCLSRSVWLLFPWRLEQSHSLHAYLWKQGHLKIKTQWASRELVGNAYFKYALVLQTSCESDSSYWRGLFRFIKLGVMSSAQTHETYIKHQHTLS